MPFESQQEFERQRTAIGVPVAANLLEREFQARPLIHSGWNNLETFPPPCHSLIDEFPDFVQTLDGTHTIRTEALFHETKEAVRYFAALLQTLGRRQNPPFRVASAVAAVIYDRATDRLYYGISRFANGLIMHQTLADRVDLMPEVASTNGGTIRTLVNVRHPETCAEFKALNCALMAGSQEKDLDLWCFRTRTMEPIPRCPNCKVTVPRNALARIWTC